MSIKRITLLVFIICLISVSFIIKLPQIFFVAAVFMGLFLSSWLWARFSTLGLVGTRGGGAVVKEDESLRLWAKLENRSRLPKAALEVLDVLPRWLVRPGLPEEAAPLDEFGGVPVAYVPFLMPGRDIQVGYEVLALKRGNYTLGPLSLRGTDPVGLFERIVQSNRFVEVTVLPALFESPAIQFGAGPMAATRTSYAPALSNDSSEVYGVRQYSPGDSLRFVHWRATARTGKMSVLQFERPVSDDLALVFDLGAGRDYGEGRESSLEYAIKIGGSIAKKALETGAIVQLAVLKDDQPTVLTFKGAQAGFDLMKALSGLESNSTMPFQHFCQGLLGQLESGIGVLLFTVEQAADTLGAARALSGASHSLITFVMRRDSFTGRRTVSEQAAYEQLEASMRQYSEATIEVSQGDNLREVVNQLGSLG